MASRRIASPAPSWVATDPQARNMSRLPSIAITPQPVRRSPGSMPRMRIGRAMPVVDNPGAGLRLAPTSRAQLLHERVGNLEIGIDVLHVVLLVEALDQLDDALALLVVDRHGVLRLPRERGLARLAEFGLQGLADRGKGIRGRVDFV